jgi:hypothetical protein
MGGNADVSDKIEIIEQLQKVVEWNRPSYLSTVIFLAVTILFILIALTITSSQSLSLATPGYISVNTKTVNIVLTEDVNWNGKSRIADKSITTTNFRVLASESYPQIEHVLDDGYSNVDSGIGGELTSLFIPKGSRIWVHHDLNNNELKIDISNDSTKLDNIVESTVTFKLFGDLSVGHSKNKAKHFPQRKCPASFVNCRLPRIVKLSGFGANMLSIAIPIAESFKLDGIGAKKLSFSDFAVGPSAIGQLNCAIDSGNFQLLSNKEPVSLNKGDCLSLESTNNRFSIVSSVTSPMEVRFYGDITSLLLGTPEFNNQQTPKLLGWLLALPGIREIGALFAGIIAIIGIIITTVGLKK